MKLWYSFQLWRWTRKARVCKAVWIANKETLTFGGKDITPSVNLKFIAKAEGSYAACIIKVKIYKMLTNPEIPKATAKEKRSA